MFPVDYPTVPKGQSRLKVTFHAGNKEDEIQKLVDSIFVFVREVSDLQDKGELGNEVPRAAREVYDWMAKEKLLGFGRM